MGRRILHTYDEGGGMIIIKKEGDSGMSCVSGVNRRNDIGYHCRLITETINRFFEGNGELGTITLLKLKDDCVDMLREANQCPVCGRKLELHSNSCAYCNLFVI